MAEALQSLVLSFDEPPRSLGAHAARAEGDAPQTIAATLRAAGIDAPCSLYNEALELAREGHLGQATSRLQMLLGLDPDDADALLLLSKIHAAQGRPQESLARLDAAVSTGAVPPPGFRDYLEAAIRAERARDEEHKARVGAREQGEVKALRAEARHLRSEVVRIETELGETRERERLWKFGAIGASGVGSALVIAMLVFGSGSPDDAVAAAPSVPAPAAASAEAGSVEAGSAEAGTVEAGSVEAAPPVAAAVAPAAVVTPEAAAPVAPAAPASGPRTHVVGSGDTLYKLASRYYGDSEQWEKIRDANKKALKGGIDLSLGQKLVIP